MSDLGRTETWVECPLCPPGMARIDCPGHPTIYVDELPSSGCGRWNGGAHMMGNDLAALHAMAARIGLKRQWFQGGSTFAHYDLTASKRRLAVAAGAVEIGLGDIPADVLMLRRSDGSYERRCDRLARKRIDHA